ncbi:DUF397 domain-containing protein [Kitasatospora sp. NPDC058965]|uniref:DUF397 domain-containing protein n=1 Tax=Kitasatospora sp. NPDC058965 TaxID=3346682 RepID=UPI00367E9A57
MTLDLAAANWFKSSYSDAGGGQCVRIATNLPDLVLVGDTKTPDAHLAVTPAAWAAFTSALAAGRLGAH